jgi:AcrR family transcriptional regulator
MKRQRRSSAEVQTRLLTAARDLFAERGFGGTTTRQIAEQAGVAETALFRHFGGKEQIFQEAIGRPIDDFLRAYTERWLSTPLSEGDAEEMLQTFVESLYDLARENRELLLAATPSHLDQGAQIPIRLLEHLAAENKARNGYDYNAYIAVRAAIAMVITVAVFDTPLFGRKPLATRDEIVEELTCLLTYGLTRRRNQTGADARIAPARPAKARRSRTTSDGRSTSRVD